MDEVKTDALVKVCPQLGIAYYEVPYAPRPVGGEFDDEDDLKITIPNIKLLQSGSAPVKKATKVEGCEEGLFFNVSSQEIFEELDVVPLYKFSERFLNLPKSSANQVCSSRDGRGKIGICFSGEYKTHGIPSKFIKEDGVDMEVGVCKACPHAKRAYGQQSSCQDVNYLVCVHRSFLTVDILEKLRSNDLKIANDILKNLFTLAFKATSLKTLDQIMQAAYASECYFNQSWKIGSKPAHTDEYDWQTYTLAPNSVLSEDEKSVAYSTMLFAQRLRKILLFTDSDVKAAPNDNEVPPVKSHVDID